MHGFGTWYFVHSSASKSSQRAVGEIYPFCFPSQGRVRYFSSQEGTTSSPRKEVFAWPKHEGMKLKKNSPGEAEAINFYNIYLFYYLIRYFVPQEESLLRTDISENSCRWLLSSFFCLCRRPIWFRKRGRRQASKRNRWTYKTTRWACWSNPTAGKTASETCRNTSRRCVFKVPANLNASKLWVTLYYNRLQKCWDTAKFWNLLDELRTRAEKYHSIH